MTKITSFDGDLGDEETIRAKLAEVELEIAEQERLRDGAEDELTRLDRVKQALLVLAGEKDAESDTARTTRLAKEQLRRQMFEEKWRAREELRRSAGSIQARVEELVIAANRPVAAADVLAVLPDATKRETVNWALWHAAQSGRIQRLSQGRYASLSYPAELLEGLEGR